MEKLSFFLFVVFPSFLALSVKNSESGSLSLSNGRVSFNWTIDSDLILPLSNKTQFPNHTFCSKEAQEKKIAVVLCDPRWRNKHGVLSMSSLFEALDRSEIEQIEFFLFHGPRAYLGRLKEMKTALQQIRFENVRQIQVRYCPLPKGNLKPYQYSNMFKSRDLWARIALQVCQADISHVLITQYDVLYSSHPYAPILKNFLKYDYIGAGVNKAGFSPNCDNISIPKLEMCCIVGGMSLRSIRATLLTLSLFPPRRMTSNQPLSANFQDNHEDLYFFSGIAKTGGSMPTDPFAIRFAEQDYFNPCGSPPFGFHQHGLVKKWPHEKNLEDCRKELEHLKRKSKRGKKRKKSFSTNLTTLKNKEDLSHFNIEFETKTKKSDHQLIALSTRVVEILQWVGLSFVLLTFFFIFRVVYVISSDRDK